MPGPIVPYAGGVASLWGFRPRGSGLSALVSARYFARRNGITGAPVVEKLPHRRGSRKTSVTATRFEAKHMPLVLYTVLNGGHTIPNPTKRPACIYGRTTRDIDAAQVVAELWRALPGLAPRAPTPRPAR